MKLEHISAVLRPRSDAEAVDLGLAMVRRHAGGMYKAWFTLIIPLWALLGLFLHNYPSAMVLVVWWLKPLYDRVVLFYLGRALFGAAPTLQEQWREWPKLLGKRLGWSLFWGRLSSVRSFTMPVVILEGLKGKPYKERTSVLNKHGGNAAFGFMQLFILLELAVILGLWFGIRPLLPEETMEWMDYARLNMVSQTPPPAALLWSLAGCYLAGVALMEPFYAGGGFGLYINSRTHLEGWDVDLAFRQLGNRLRGHVATAAPALSILFCTLWLVIGSAVPAFAQPVDKEAAASEIKEILSHPDFTEHIEKSREWVSAPSPPSSPPPPEPAGWDWGWMTRFTDAISNFFSGDWKQVAFRLIWATLIAGLLAWLGWLLWKHYQSRLPRAHRVVRSRGPRTVMGMEVTPESLPRDVPAAAWAVWQQGDQAGAVGLLYRGSLAWLMEQGRVPIRGSDTEGDCLRHAGTLPDAGRRHYFTDLTQTWLAAAYGKSPPGPDLMKGLCERWPFALLETAALPSVPMPSVPPVLPLLLMLAAVFLTGCKGHWEDREKELGHLGEARRNPWLAATRLLEMNGYSVVQQRSVLDLPDREAVLIVPADAVLSEAMAKRLIDWTRRGGHLIYLAEGGEQYRNDWGQGSGGGGMVRQALHPLLTLLEVDIVEKSSAGRALDMVRIGDQEFKTSFGHQIRFDVREAELKGHFKAGDAEETPLVSLRSGGGRITLLAHAHPFRNRWIDDDEHAALLLGLVSLTGQGYEVIFVKAGRVSLWAMLKEHASPALLATAVLLVFWLWSVLPRFGPLRSLPLRGGRRFATHLDEAGSFLWKQGLTDALLDAPRMAVLAAARRQSYREDERLFTSLLATRAGLSVERVHDALYSGNAKDGRLFTIQMADLQTLLAALSPRRYS